MRSLSLFIMGLIGLVATAAMPAAAAEGPAQPAKGPGGSDYVTSDVIKRSVGAGSEQAFVFYPAEPADKPRPVVVFLHTWGAVSPKWYGAWIGHLARKGNVVIYPRYQIEGGVTKLNEVSGEALTGAKIALDALAADAQARPDLTKVAFVGHSTGAIIAANMAARAAADGLPVPRLVYGAMPALVPTDAKTRAVPLTDLGALDPRTSFVMVTGDRDTVAREAGARAILRQAGAKLDADHRLLIKLPSDNHGDPALVMAHYSAGAPNDAYDLSKIEGALTPVTTASAKPGTDKASREAARRDTSERWWLTRIEQGELQLLGTQKVDSVDWYGLWRTLDIAMQVTFSGKNASEIKRVPGIYDMGRWADDWPVRRLSLESPKDSGGPAPAVAGQQRP